jgi:hypothetical protein
LEPVADQSLPAAFVKALSSSFVVKALAGIADIAAAMVVF